MTWFLLLSGLLLFGLGLWGGPRPRPQEQAPPETQPASPEQALEILTQPIPDEEEELIRIPEHRPWYLPDRRFQQGLLTGLGAGLLIAAAAIAFLPREPLLGPPDGVAGEPPDGLVGEPPDGLAGDPPGADGAPPTPQPDPGPTPDPTDPPADPGPDPEPPRPANVTFVVELGDTAPAIARRLVAEGLIADEEAFLREVEARGVDRFLRAGTFVIPTDASLDEVIDALTA